MEVMLASQLHHTMTMLDLVETDCTVTSVDEGGPLCHRDLGHFLLGKSLAHSANSVSQLLKLFVVHDIGVRILG